MGLPGTEEEVRGGKERPLQHRKGPSWFEGCEGARQDRAAVSAQPPAQGSSPAEFLSLSAEFIPALLANTFIYYQSTSCSFQSQLGPAEQT